MANSDFIPKRELLYEDENMEDREPDPDEVPVSNRKLFTQPYDLVIGSILDQVGDKLLFLRPLSDVVKTL